MIKSINQKGFAAAQFILILIVVVIVGFAGWYVWQQQQDTNKTLNNFGDSEPTANISPTPTPATESTKNELDTLKEFCEPTEETNELGMLQYVENSNGKFASCGINSIEGAGGAMLIAKYINNEWKQIWAGNGIMEASYCTEYKIPSSIYADCTGNY
jgi:uncharacterized protein (UPF0333 family)